MNRLTSIVLALVVTLIIFLALVYVGGNILGIERLQTGENPLLRFVFVIIGLLLVFVVYFFTSSSKAWEVGTRQVVYMGIGAALYAVLSYIFNGTVFAVPSVSQVALRPAICIPVFFGYAFGPMVGLFTGAVGNMFGDALTGFGLSPQWSLGNGLVGMISGLVALYADKKKSVNFVMIVSAVVAALATLIYLFNPSISNMLYFNPDENIFGDQQITLFAGVSAVIGFVLILAVRFLFGKNIDVAAAVTWGMLGNLIGLGFAAIADIWINGLSLAATTVGQFLPAAGPNLIFIAVLVPLLVGAYSAAQRQTGR